MSRPKYPTMLIACVALAAACNNDEAVSAPHAGPTNDIVPAAAGTSASSTGPIKSGVPLANVCLDIKGGTTTAPAAGAPLQVWQCHGGANQQFTLQANGTITAYGGQRCLDVWGARANDGDVVDAYDCNGGTNQKWTYTSAGQLRTAVNGKCLDLWGAQGQDGAPVKVWPCHGGANQKWTVPPASVSVAPPTTPITVSASGSTAGSAELPRTYLNTAMPAVTGRTISVPAGGDLQGALNAAQPGDQVVLAAGATFTGNFVLPAKAGMTGAQWITVRTSGALPAEGARVGPGDAAQMPKLLTPNSAPALSTALATQGWRLVGLEIGASSQAQMTYAFVVFGNAGGESSLAQIASRLVLDRSYVHGTPRYNIRRCVLLNSAASAVIDSYLSECHSNDSDSQAILGWNGPGPFKIVNNHLEGGHEIVMFGGGDPSIQGILPSDIEIRRNHFIRPLGWKGVWQAKNLFELKTGQRVLVEGNVFENNWVDAQNGFGVVLNSEYHNSPCSWCVTQDVTMRHNLVRNTPHGFNLAALGPGPETTQRLPMRRVTIVNNIVLGVDMQGGRMFQVMGSLAGLTITRNTAIGGSSDVYFVTPDQPLPTFVFQNNVTGGTYTLFGDGGVAGKNAMARLSIPAASVVGNVFVASSMPYVIPSGNTSAASASAVGLGALAGGDISTASVSGQFSTAGTAGTTPGADATALKAAISGVVR